MGLHMSIVHDEVMKFQMSVVLELKKGSSLVDDALILAFIASTCGFFRPDQVLQLFGGLEFTQFEGFR